MLAIMSSVIEAVKEAGPMGAPAGPMYAGMMGFGISLDNFNAMMGALVSLGRLRHDPDSHLYFIAD